MAECSDNLSEVKRRPRLTSDEELGRFAHRLSLDVTNDALNMVLHNGVTTPSQTQPSAQIPQIDSETQVSESDRPQSLPNTPGSSCRSADHDRSFEDCHRQQQQHTHSRNPVGKIRDVSRTIAKWLRFKSKSSNGLDEKGTSESPWRPWRMSGKRQREDPSKRALPPVPVDGRRVVVHQDEPAQTLRMDRSLDNLMAGDAYMPDEEEDEIPTFAPSASGNIDFAASIEKVKDYGWYWGPISGEAAERLLSNEPDGSFLVRDSSDDHYIFSLTFKLTGTVRHVRIEHDQGNFSFGTFTKFKSNTIVDFIENAVEHSRSGRYLFFLHRRPVYGPMRVQLLHPVSRFKQVQSLQHLCRFVILKMVPRDLLFQLPVPKRLRDYLNTPFYYSEAIADWTGLDELPDDCHKDIQPEALPSSLHNHADQLSDASLET